MANKPLSIKRLLNAAPLMEVILLLSLVLFPMKVYALKVGDKAPAFHVFTLKGQEISYDVDLRGKKPVYLIFWTTW